MTSFALKIIAIVGMTANHASYVFEDALLAGDAAGFAAWCVLHALGGVTFPLMAYLVVEGYRRTSNFTRYLGRLLLFALIAQVPWMLVLGLNLNVLFTLALGLALLRLYDKNRRQPWFWPLCVMAILASAACDWGVLGPVMVLMFHVLEKEGGRRRAVVLTVGTAMLVNGLPSLNAAFTGVAIAWGPLLYASVGHTAAAALLCAYNGKRGRPLKWFFYAYYPAHIAALGVLAQIVA